MIKITEVRSKSDLQQFIAFPDKLYKNNPHRVPQLHSFERSTLLKEKNPAFDYCEAKYWLAHKDGKIVGRIAGIINSEANKKWNEKTVRFGWIDFMDDKEVSEALIKTVENWGIQKGMNKVVGPMGFTDMDLEGMLVDGFDELSTQAVIYNFPYYPQHLEEYGYTKDVDWVQYEIKVPDKVPDKVVRIAELVKQKYGLRILEVKKPKQLLPYAGKMFDTLNEAFDHLYGFAPLTDRQKKYYVDKYFSMINPKYVSFVVDKEDDVVGFGLGFLSLSKALIKAKGKLYPFGFIKIVKDMNKNNMADLLLQAVRNEYKTKGVPALFYAHMMQAFIDNGVKTVISSHVLEENKNSLMMFTNGYDARLNMRRRAYKKEL
ncbi:GTP cyclohydrolase [Fluviicola taffensis]|uniref:GTP cyclohydrolase n=1 Tax=Fluviicola taffensis TaxID=191579 RepID=UPI00313821A7